MNQYNKNILGGNVSLNGRDTISAQLDQYAIEPQSAALAPDMGNLATEMSVTEEDSTTEGTTMRSTNDATKVTKTISNYLDLPRRLLNMPDDGSEPTLKQFLAKPYIVQSGELQATDLPTTFPNVRLSSAMFTNKYYQEKIHGILSLRYTTVITLQVNANKFQQGRYILGFVPTGGMRDDGINKNVTTWIDMHRANKTQITQLHHVEIDINKTTEVQLRIPYQGGFTAMANYTQANLQTFGDPGVFFLYPYSALKAAAGSAAAGYTIWVHYEDVETFGNTAYGTYVAPVKAEPQMAWNPRRSKQGKKLDLLGAETEKPRSASTGLRLISEGAGELTKVPFLSSIAGPVSWATDFLSNAAYSFGWSKPRVNTEICRQNRFPHAYIATHDQGDDAQPLALSSQNRVGVLPGFASTDLDELDIDYLKSIPSYIDTIPWPLTSTASTLLWKRDLSPYHLMGPPQDAMDQHTTVSFFSTLFSRYSGGFRFHIKIVKTEFHAGRLLFAFNPVESSIFNNTDTKFEDTALIHKTILDVREKSEFIIEVPFVSILPWRNCHRNFDQPTTQNFDASFGSVSLFVLDELVAPETVVNSVDILIEVSGADDLRFSVPIGAGYAPVHPTEMQMSSPFKSSIDPLIIDTDTVGGASVSQDTIVKDEACVGEVITSLRPLLKRGSLMGYTVASSATTQNLNVLPYAWICQEAGTGFTADMTYDIFTMLSSMYALQRGGVRLRIMQTSAAGQVTASMRNTNGGEPSRKDVFHITNTKTQDYIDDSPNRPLANQLQQLGGLAVDVPYYHYNHASTSAGQMIAQNSDYTFALTTGANNNTVDFQFQPAINFATTTTYRAGADDCNFGCFVSIPLFGQIATRPA